MTDPNTTGDGPLVPVSLIASVEDDPFGHGPCRMMNPPCQKPAVMEGGYCAAHIATLYAPQMASGIQAHPGGRKPSVGQRRAARRKMANASRRRNRK